MRVDDSRYREVMGCRPRGRRAWAFRIPFFGCGQALDGKSPDVRAWKERFAHQVLLCDISVPENPSFSIPECDWKKARKIAVKYAASLGVSLVEVEIPYEEYPRHTCPRGLFGGER